MTAIVAQIVFIGSAIALSLLILLQQSKESGMASLGGGSSSSVFGARGADNFLYKLTRGLAIVFFVSALAMGYVQNKEASSGSILQEVQHTDKKDTQKVDVPASVEDNTPSSSDVPQAPAQENTP